MPYFEYCTVQDLRDAGVSVDKIADDALRNLIRIASARINKFTGQWFAPIIGDQYVDGQSSPRVWLPNLVPIVKLTAIAIISNQSARKPTLVLPDRREFGPISLTDVGISRNGRFVEFIVTESGTLFVFSSQRVSASELLFPEGVKNVKLTGVFGWLEDLKELEVEVQANAAVGDSKIVVDDATGWDTGDWAVFPDNEIQMVTGVKHGDNELLFLGDAEKLKVAVTTGDKIKTYGRSLLLIRECTVRLAARAAGDRAKLSGTINGADDPTALAIISERTDNYSYRKDPRLVSQAIQAGGTGDTWVDSTLEQIIDEIPPMVAFV